MIGTKQKTIRKQKINSMKEQETIKLLYVAHRLSDRQTN